MRRSKRLTPKELRKRTSKERHSVTGFERLTMDDTKSHTHTGKTRHKIKFSAFDITT